MINMKHILRYHIYAMWSFAFPKNRLHSKAPVMLNQSVKDKWRIKTMFKNKINKQKLGSSCMILLSYQTEIFLYNSETILGTENGVLDICLLEAWIINVISKRFPLDFTTLFSIAFYRFFFSWIVKISNKGKNKTVSEISTSFSNFCTNLYDPIHTLIDWNLNKCLVVQRLWMRRQ